MYPEMCKFLGQSIVFGIRHYGDNGLLRVMCYYTKEDQSGEKPDSCPLIQFPTYTTLCTYKLRSSPPLYIDPVYVCMDVWTGLDSGRGIGLKVTRRVNKNRQTCKLAY